MKIIKPQLSHSLELNQEPNGDYFKTNRLKGSWFMSEKFDGIRALWNGKELMTRVGRKFTWVPQWFLDLLPKDIVLDGELLIPNEPFGFFSSISIQKECEASHEKWKRVVYNIFDTPIGGYTFEQRLEKLKNINFNSNQLKIVNFTKLEDIQKEFNRVNKAFDKIVKNEGEGVMLIYSKSFYKHAKRSRESLKYKKKHEGEARVVNIHIGKKKYSGMMGKIECKLPNGKKFCCGTGFNDAQRGAYKFDKETKKFLSLDESVPNCPNIGDIITYSCMEIIKKTKVPRMAVYKGIRTDFD